MSRVRMLAGVMVLGLSCVAAVSACSAQQQAMMAAMGQGGTDPAGMGPALRVPALDGTMLDEPWARGNVVIVDFWASWCQPCQHSIPFYRRMYERWHPRGLRVVGVNVDDDRQGFLDYLAVHPMPFSLVFDDEKRISQRFSVFQLPTTFLFDRRGRLRKQRSGFDPTEARQVEDEIRLLLGEERP